LRRFRSANSAWFSSIAFPATFHSEASAREFFNMTVADTLKTWTVAETIIGVAGLAFTMLLSPAL
jgi:H+/gluconate symporter-like permease